MNPAVDLKTRSALKLLNGEFQDGDTIEVDADPAAGELRFQKLVPVEA